MAIDISKGAKIINNNSQIAQIANTFRNPIKTIDFDE